MEKLDYLPSLPGFVTTQQFAQVAGVTYRTVIRAIVEDKIIAYRMGGTIAIPETELEKAARVFRPKVKDRVQRLMKDKKWSRGYAYRKLQEGV